MCILKNFNPSKVFIFCVFPRCIGVGLYKLRINNFRNVQVVIIVLRVQRYGFYFN